MVAESQETCINNSHTSLNLAVGYIHVHVPFPRLWALWHHRYNQEHHVSSAVNDIVVHKNSA